MRLAFLGNFGPPYSTENDYRQAWTNNGHHVDIYQEGDPAAIQLLTASLRPTVDPYDFVVWTRTEDLAAKLGDAPQWKLLAEARRYQIPVIAVHLDRWWGLDRQKLIDSDPFFRVDLMITPDGAHDEQWQAAGIRHRWLLPGVSKQWCKPGMYRDQYASDIAFVGGWQGGYHKEAKHRFELVNWLDTTYGDRIRFWPKRGEHAVRGTDLTDLYWSTKVVVGDSCLVPTVEGKPMHHYCSDRIPETLGRGGILIHPYVEGVTFAEFSHLAWTLGDFDELREVIEITLADDDARQVMREESLDVIGDSHTYDHRVPQIIDIIKQEGLICER